MDNLPPFRDTIADSEIGTELLSLTDDGYNVLVGSTPNHPILFTDYSTHPNVLNHALDSTAAGRYQINHPTYLDYCQEVGPIDFDHEAQDMIAEWLIEKSNALEEVDAGHFEDAVYKCSVRWASFPGSDSGQHQNQMAALKEYFISKGGVCA